MINLSELSDKELVNLQLRIEEAVKQRYQAGNNIAPPDNISSPVNIPRSIVQEYEQRVARGEKVDPLVPFVGLEDLVTREKLKVVDSFNEKDLVIEQSLRAENLKFFAPNRRAMWQSLGQEYIEPDLLDFIDDLSPRSVYFDIGASTGVFAMYAASKGICTYCFEPEVCNFNILNTNAFLNSSNIHSNFNAFNVAISDDSRVDSLFIKEFSPASHEKVLGKPSSRGKSGSFNQEYEQRVICLSLDNFCRLENIMPTDLKIDVDGAELSVLKGMIDQLEGKILKRIFIELSEVEPHSMECIEMLKSYDFKITSRKRVQNYFTEFNYLFER